MATRDELDTDIFGPEPDMKPLTREKLQAMAERHSLVNHRIYCAEIELGCMLKPKEKLTVRSDMRRYSRKVGIHSQRHWPSWVGPVQRPQNPFELTNEGKFRMMRAFSEMSQESDSLVYVSSMKAGLNELLAVCGVHAAFLFMGGPIEGPMLNPLEGISLEIQNQSYETREFRAIITGLLAL